LTRELSRVEEVFQQLSAWGPRGKKQRGGERDGVHPHWKRDRQQQKVSKKTGVGASDVWGGQQLKKLVLLSLVRKKEALGERTSARTRSKERSLIARESSERGIGQAIGQGKANLQFQIQQHVTGGRSGKR